MTDPISDMLTRIRNVILIKRKKVNIPFSKFKFSIAKFLEREGLIEKAEVFSSLGFLLKKRKKKGLDKFKEIRILLKYRNGRSVISNLKRISKPGRRLYVKWKDIPQLNRNRKGIIVLSTSKGIMSTNEAWKKKTGGEILFEVW
ncbi:30S ribosomal protein S8 [bacterium]|nr:30S ribosomal protein S8 [bacterium]